MAKSTSDTTVVRAELGDTSTTPTTDVDHRSENKKRKFRPLEAVRKLFKSGKKRSKLKDNEQLSIVSVRAKSTSALHRQSAEEYGNDDDGGFLSRISLRKTKSRSEDSVLMEPHVHKPGMLRKLAYSVEGINNSLQSSYSGRTSEHSLYSADSSEGNESFLKDWRSHIAFQRQGSQDTHTYPGVDLEVVAKTQSLNTDAAKFKISVRPKARKGSRQNRRNLQKMSSNLPSLNEEQHQSEIDKGEQGPSEQGPSEQESCKIPSTLTENGLEISEADESLATNTVWSPTNLKSSVSYLDMSNPSTAEKYENDAGESDNVQEVNNSNCMPLQEIKLEITKYNNSSTLHDGDFHVKKSFPVMCKEGDLNELHESVRTPPGPTSAPWTNIVPTTAFSDKSMAVIDNTNDNPIVQEELSIPDFGIHKDCPSVKSKEDSDQFVTGIANTPAVFQKQLSTPDFGLHSSISEKSSLKENLPTVNSATGKGKKLLSPMLDYHQNNQFATVIIDTPAVIQKQLSTPDFGQNSSILEKSPSKENLFAVDLQLPKLGNQRKHQVQSQIFPTSSVVATPAQKTVYNAAASIASDSCSGQPPKTMSANIKPSPFLNFQPSSSKERTPPADDVSKTVPQHSWTPIHSPVDDSSKTAPQHSWTPVHSPVDDSTKTAPQHSWTPVHSPVDDSSKTAPQHSWTPPVHSPTDDSSKTALQHSWTPVHSSTGTSSKTVSQHYLAPVHSPTDDSSKTTPQHSWTPVHSSTGTSSKTVSQHSLTSVHSPTDDSNKTAPHYSWTPPVHYPIDDSSKTAPQHTWRTPVVHSPISPFSNVPARRYTSPSNLKSIASSSFTNETPTVEQPPHPTPGGVIVRAMSVRERTSISSLTANSLESATVMLKKQAPPGGGGRRKSTNSDNHPYSTTALSEKNSIDGNNTNNNGNNLTVGYNNTNRLSALFEARTSSQSASADKEKPTTKAAFSKNPVPIPPPKSSVASASSAKEAPPHPFLPPKSCIASASSAKETLVHPFLPPKSSIALVSCAKEAPAHPFPPPKWSVVSASSAKDAPTHRFLPPKSSVASSTSTKEALILPFSSNNKVSPLKVISIKDGNNTDTAKEAPALPNKVTSLNEISSTKDGKKTRTATEVPTHQLPPTKIMSPPKDSNKTGMVKEAPALPNKVTPLKEISSNKDSNKTMTAKEASACPFLPTKRVPPPKDYSFTKDTNKRGTAKEAPALPNKMTPLKGISSNKDGNKTRTAKEAPVHAFLLSNKVTPTKDVNKAGMAAKEVGMVRRVSSAKVKETQIPSRQTRTVDSTAGTSLLVATTPSGTLGVVATTPWKMDLNQKKHETEQPASKPAKVEIPKTEICKMPEMRGGSERGNGSPRGSLEPTDSQKAPNLREKPKMEKCSKVNARQSKVLDIVKNFQKLQAT